MGCFDFTIRSNLHFKQCFIHDILRSAGKRTAHPATTGRKSTTRTQRGCSQCSYRAHQLKKNPLKFVFPHTEIKIHTKHRLR